MEFAPVAEQYHTKRGASKDRQAVIYARRGSEPYLHAIWPLFVFACISWSRRFDAGSWRGVPHPEQFYVPSVTPRDEMLFFGTGRTSGVGGPEHLPLPWPVDGPVVLRDTNLDQRIRLACKLAAFNPKDPPSSVVMAIGAAAELANASMEYLRQKIANTGPATRAFTLLASAFEVLHRGERSDFHRHSEVTGALCRLRSMDDCITERLFASKTAKDPTASLQSGDEQSRVTLCVSRLFWIRNQLAHGHVVPDELYLLPEELGRREVLRSSLLVLAAVLGQDLLRSVQLEIPIDSMKVDGGALRSHGLSLDEGLQASYDAQSMDRALGRVLCPPSEEG